MLRVFKLKHCNVHFFNGGVDGGVDAIFGDVASTNWPWLDDANWLGIMRSAGYEDPLQYCQEHDFFHAFLADRWFDKPSYVLWQAAHELPIDPNASSWEERLIFDFQRAFTGYDIECSSSWEETIIEARRVLYETSESVVDVERVLESGLLGSGS
jgi:hypothetical protein